MEKLFTTSLRLMLLFVSEVDMFGIDNVGLEILLLVFLY